MDLTDQVVYLQPSEHDLVPQLQHYIAQKHLHPELGAMLVIPATSAAQVSTELGLFQHVHSFRKEFIFRTRHDSKKLRARTEMRVYINRPIVQSGFTGRK